MAGRSTHGRAGPETLEKESAGYDSDFYSWSQEQGRLVREGRWSEVDRENVAEEIESLGREQFNKLESAFRVLITAHAEMGSPACAEVAKLERYHSNAAALSLSDVLADNPGLKPRINEAIARALSQSET